MLPSGSRTRMRIVRLTTALARSPARSTPMPASRLAKKEKIIDYVIELHGAGAPGIGADSQEKGNWDLFQKFHTADSDAARLKAAKRLLRAV